MNTATTADEFDGQGANGQRRTQGGGKPHAQRSKRDAAPDFATLVSDVEDLLQKLGHIADGEIAQVRDRLQKKVEDVRDTLAKNAIPIARGVRKAVDVTDDFVREHPWQSTGLAALAGVLIGFVFLRK